jgi:thioredoxin-related protein
MTATTRIIYRIPALAAAVLGLLVFAGCKRSAPPPATKPAATQQSAATIRQNAAYAAAAPLREQLLTQYDLKGRVAMIEFGMVINGVLTCELSAQGLDGMVLHQKLNDVPGLAFLRVEESKDTAAVDAYYKDKDLKFPVYRDPNMTMAHAFMATSVPTFVLVDKFGRVRYRGSEPGNQLGKWVADLQAEKADAGPDVAMLGVVTLDGAKLLAATALQDLSGQRVALDGAMGPQGIVLVFVDTTCPFSGQALRDMPTVAPTLSKANINSFVVNIDGSKEVVTKYYGGKNLGAPVIYDPTDATLTRWNIKSTPAIVYIGPDKTIAYNGVAVWADVASAIEKARQLPPGTIKFTARGTSYG